MSARDAGQLTHLRLEQLAQTRHAGHAAEVHEVYGLGAVRQHPLDGGDELLRIELRRGRGRGDEGALRAVERAVGDAEGVAGEDAGVRRVHDGVVVQRVPRDVDELERAAAEAHPLAILDHAHARGRDRQQLPVQLLEALAVDRARALDQAAGVDHVRRAARMQHRHGVGELLHQPPRPAGVVQVHVRQQHVVHRRARDAKLGERRQQVGDGSVGAHIDEGRATAILDDVRGGVPGIEVLGIDGADAVRVSIQSRLQGNVDLCAASRMACRECTHRNL